MSIIVQGVTFTDSAIAKIQGLLQQEESKKMLFYLKVIGGGCSGLQYDYDLAEGIDCEESSGDSGDSGDSGADSDSDAGAEDLLGDGDAVTTKKLLIKMPDNLPIAMIDYDSLQYLQGVTVDYVDDLTKSSFVINNPQAKAKCGCGNSFTY